MLKFGIRRTLSTASREKPVVVVVGAGWAGYRCANDLDKSKFNVVVISPRNHFLFTPLLPSTAVGTLEFRAIQEPIRTIPNLHYHQAVVNQVDFENSTLLCTDAFKLDGHTFSVKYDALIFATGSETNTFGVPGVSDNENVYFLKQLSDTRGIRNRLIDCFERASSPGATKEEIKRLLRFVIVGGGPTNIEFASELFDFLKEDVTRLYPDLHQYCEVVVVEAAQHVLGSFNATLVGYVERLFQMRHIRVITNTAVKAVKGDSVQLSDGQSLTFGMLVWSTGVQQVEAVRQMNDKHISKAGNGRIIVDHHFRAVSSMSSGVDSSNEKATTTPTSQPADVIAPFFALGDCACDKDKPLPALAQVASQQAKYLAKLLNVEGIDGAWQGKGKPFSYHHLGMMASVGQWKGIWDAGYGKFQCFYCSCLISLFLICLSFLRKNE